MGGRFEKNRGLETVQIDIEVDSEKIAQGHGGEGEEFEKKVQIRF